MVKQNTETQERLSLTIILLLFARLMVNIPRRFPYPFLPEISRALDVPLSSAQSVIALQSGIGITSPVFGALLERFGRKQVMISALVLMAGASAFGAVLPQFGVFLVVMVLLGLGKMLFDPSMQAYMGDKVPYPQRGRALGILELAWAGSLLIASPIVGWLLGVGSLRLVFFLLAIALALAAGLLGVLLPSDQLGKTQPQAEGLSLLAGFRLLRQHPPASAALGFGFCVSAANEILFINYGAFMETSFGLTAAALGILTTVIAAAEVGGEFMVIGIADRFGKRRLTLIGTCIASLCYLVIPFLSASLPLALFGIFVLFFAVEMGIVASIPIYTEVLPNARSVMLTAIIGAVSLGRLSGSSMGTLLYGLTQNFVLMGVVSAGVGLTGVVLMWRYVRSDPNQPVQF